MVCLKTLIARAARIGVPPDDVNKQYGSSFQMFTKRLLSKDILYFRYAPPLTRLDDATDDDLPNPPFHNAPPHMRSVFYYWWSFLRESEDYIATCDNGGTGKLADLHKDFGDIRDDKFFDWWRRTGRNIFCEPVDRQIKVITSDRIEHDSDKVVLSISVTGDMGRILAELKSLLNDSFREVRQSSYRDSHARYPVHTKPVLTSLHLMLELLKAKKSNPSGSLLDWGKAINLGLISGKTDADVLASERSAISRYIRKAEKLMINVEQGRFPDFT